MYFDTTYTNGVIAVKEKLLLKEKLTRLCEVSIDEGFRILSESGFGAGVTDKTYEYEKLIQAESAELDAFIRLYAPSKVERAYFLLPYDFHNAKALLKAKVLGENPEKMLVSEGLVSVETLQTCIQENAYDALTHIPALAKALQEGVGLLETEVSGMKLGALLERGLYEALTKTVKHSPVLRKLLSAKIDMTNVLIALRAGDEELAKQQYLSGGTLTHERLQVLFTGDSETIRATFAKSMTSEFIELCLRAKEKNMPYVEAEKYRDALDVTSLERRRFDLVKNEPFLYYVYRKKAEIAGVRIVFACKFAGLDETQIKNRLRK